MSILGVNCIVTVVAIPDDKLPALHALGKTQRFLPDISTDAILSERFVFKRYSPRRKPHVRFSNIAFCLSLLSIPNHSGGKKSIEMFDLAVKRRIKAYIF